MFKYIVCVPGNTTHVYHCGGSTYVLSLRVGLECYEHILWHLEQLNFAMIQGVVRGPVRVAYRIVIVRQPIVRFQIRLGTAGAARIAIVVPES